MSPPISFSAACSQFGAATMNMVQATWNAPFTGGRVRMVAIGLPLLFVTTGVSSIIFYVMSTILVGMKNKASKWVTETTTYWSRHNVEHVNCKPQKKQKTHTVGFLGSSSNTEVNRQEKEREVERKEPVEPLRPLPVDAAKQRDEALAQFLDLVDLYFLTPWILENKKLLYKATETQDPFLKALIDTEGLLKGWLRSIALWQLGEQWDRLEIQFVKMESPEPPTFESLERQIKQERFSKTLEEALLAPINDRENHQGASVSNLQTVITDSELSDNKKMELMALSFQFNSLLQGKGTSQETRAQELENERKKFAVIMNQGLASTLKEMIGVMKGWMNVIQALSPSKKPAPSVPANTEEKEETQCDLDASFYTSSTEVMVKTASEGLSKEVSTKYLDPLWEKQQKKWEQALEKQINDEKVDENKKNLITRYLQGEASDTDFLKEARLSTSLISQVAFMRMISIMKNKNEEVKKSINTFPASLLLHLQPTISSFLGKIFTTLSEISFERTVPKVVKYTLDLLECCSAMQTAQKDQKFLRQKPVFIQEALTDGDHADHAKEIQGLHDSTPDEKTKGSDVIHKLKEQAHDAVRLSHPELQEQIWIRKVKVELEGVLRVRAAQFSNEPGGEWLASLLKTKKNGSRNLFRTILSFQNKVWAMIPGLEKLVKIALLGLQTFIEEEGIAGIQSSLNTITSTRYISTEIGTGVIKSLLDQATTEEAWAEGFSVLRKAFEHLDDDEQKVIFGYIETQKESTPSPETRAQALKNPINQDDQELIEPLKKSKEEEAALLQALNTIQEAMKSLGNSKSLLHQNLKTSQAQDIRILQENDSVELFEDLEKKHDHLELGYAKMSRARDLKQFHRIKGLVMFSVDHLLTKTLHDAVGDKIGDNLKEIILSVLHEAYTLLSYQEVVKHLIFTITDILITELKLAIEPPAENNQHSTLSARSKTPSLFDYIQVDQQAKLQQKLASLINECHQRKGWTSMANWMTWGVSVAASWQPATVWGYLTQAFQDTLRIEPKDFSKLIERKLNDFVTDPEQLPALIIDALTKHVADPRPEQQQVAME